MAPARWALRVSQREEHSPPTVHNWETRMSSLEIDSQTPAKRWHVAKWPPLAWLETGIKLIALAFGLAALADALSTVEFALPSGARLAQFILMTLLSLGLVAAIFDRIVEREMVAMGFVILNNLGHWGMVLALVTDQGPGSRLVPFASLMLLGDVVKLAFLKVHDFQVRDTPRSVLFGLTLFYAAGYFLLLILKVLG